MLLRSSKSEKGTHVQNMCVHVYMCPSVHHSTQPHSATGHSSLRLSENFPLNVYILKFIVFHPSRQKVRENISVSHTSVDFYILLTIRSAALSDVLETDYLAPLPRVPKVSGWHSSLVDTCPPLGLRSCLRGCQETPPEREVT